MWRRARVLFALVFVGLVGGLMALRGEGYLGGRAKGGPLRIGTAGVSATATAGRIYAFGLDGTLAGDPVRVQNVRSLVVSPELEVLGPNVYSGTCGACRTGSWPPADATGPLEDATLREATPRSIMGLRAQRAGIYYALGLVVDYRRGQRRYRDREPQRLCISISRRQRCDLDYRGPGAARVAQVGGPARYPGARVTEEAATYRGPGQYRLRITLANQTRSVIDASEIAFDPNRSGIAVVATEPEDVRLSPHGFEVVRLRLSVPGQCAGTTSAARLRAKLDGDRRSIPLSLPLRFACG